MFSDLTHSHIQLDWFHLLTSGFNRHRRTHERSDGSEGPYGSYSGEEEDYEGEDQFGSLEEESPHSEHGYLPTSMSQSFGSMQAMTMAMSNQGMAAMAAPSQLINTQHLMQQPI